ncbi:ANTAR domain-containing response regulator [Paenibacillus daejeonensis]|uniref:ANTAR domain-containing response regulator n=1 Tax=Paenibacillus daejeonensis TaxID=135193 RepID=UPI00037F1B0A|nr:ANTAR domain-containing protein [Paenibacillus daejeonensis]
MPKTLMLIEDSAASAHLQQLKHCCRSLHQATSKDAMKSYVSVVEAVVLDVPLSRLTDWQASIAATRRLPVFWLCSEPDATGAVDWGYVLDGLLYPSMTVTEMQYAIQWGMRVHQQRKRWSEEREQLIQRLEERKWIDQAKAVLCEVKGISEAEAYDFLRKQAMNERKRIGDIAASIVKVYQLIHG